jgi:hypothetical protein
LFGDCVRRVCLEEPVFTLCRHGVLARERLEITLRGTESIVQLVHPPLAVLDDIGVDLVAPFCRCGRDELLATQTVLWCVLVQGEEFARRFGIGLDIQVGGYKTPGASPSGDFLQERYMFLFVPPLQLLLLVLPGLQDEGHGNHDVLLPFVLDFLQVLEIAACPLAKKVVRSAIYEDLLHRIPLALRLHGRRTQFLVCLLRQMLQSVEIIDGHPFWLFL